MPAFTFLICYLIFMIPTYFLRFAVFQAAFEYGGQAVQTDNSLGSQMQLFKSEQQLNAISGSVETILLLCYIVLFVVSVLRGFIARRSDLFAYPIIAGAFDILIPFIPFAPTIMHLIALTRGVGANEKSIQEPIIFRLRDFTQSFRIPDTSNWKFKEYAAAMVLTFGVSVFAFAVLFTLFPPK